jgi:D-alanyl-D-alanine carboxypeptidase
MTQRFVLAAMALTCIFPLQTTGASVDHIDRLLSAAFDQAEPGAAVIVADGESVILRKGYGLADLESGISTRPEMVYPIGSETKSFTAVAVAILAERGLLSFDDAISQYLPNLPAAYDSVTILNLLSHTAGVPDLFAPPYYQLMEERCFALINDDVEIEEFLELFIHLDFDFAPGSAFSYSNAGYYLLGQLIERVTNMEYSQFLSESILKPLQLESTCYYSNIAIIPHRAPSYLDENQGFIRNPYSCLSGSILYSAGGLMSSVDDLARFYAALQSDELLDAESCRLLFTPQTSDVLAGTTQVGIGFWLGRLKGQLAVWHGGDAYGFHAATLYLPNDRVFIAILSNNPYKTTAVLDPLAKRIAAIVINDPFPELAPITLRPEQLACIGGTYRINETDTRKVIVEGSHIFTQRNDGRRIEAYAASPDTLLYSSSLNFITFEEDDRGNVVRMIMHRETGDEETADKE